MATSSLGKNPFEDRTNCANVGVPVLFFVFSYHHFEVSITCAFVITSGKVLMILNIVLNSIILKC